MKRLGSLALATALLLTGGVWLRYATRSSGAQQVSVGSAMQLRWPVGERAVFGVTWQSTTKGFSVRGRPAVDGKAGFEGDIAIEALGTKRGETTLALSIVSVAKLDADISGQAATNLDDMRQALVGPHALLTVSSRGEIKALKFETGTPVPTQAALRALAVQLHFMLPAAGEDTWETSEPVPMGTMRQRYARDGQRLVRHAVAFERLEGRPETLDGAHVLHGEAIVDLADARLTSIHDNQRWSYTPRGDAEPFVTTEFTFKAVRKTIGFADLAALARIDTGDFVTIDKPPTDSDLAHRRDTRLAEGVTVSSILMLVDAQARGAKLDGQAAVKAAAYLRLHPEAAKPLVEKFADGSTDSAGRAFVLDLLTQAGDAPAQEAMRTALGRVQLPSSERGLLVQRFSFLTSPTPESVRFVEEEYTRAKARGSRGTAQGAATALGALAQHLDANGDPALANATNARLQAELQTTQDPAILAAVVAGLGNAKRADNVPLLARVAGHSDSRVRSYAADALRSVDAPEARRALMGLTTDVDPTVSSLAFASLHSQTLDQADWRDLATRVTSGKTNRAADASLVGLLRVRKDEAGDEAIAILRVLAERNGGGDNDLTTMIRELMVRS